MLYATIDRQVFGLVAAEMSETLKLSNTQLGLIQGIGFALFTFLGAYPIAWFADRFDKRWVLAVCTASWALGTAACGFASGFVSLFVASAAVAAAEAGIAPIFMSLLPELFRGQARVTATMIYYVAISLSMASGLFLVGAMISGINAMGPVLSTVAALENWRWAFLAAAAPFPLFASMLFILPKGHVTGGKARAAAALVPIGPFLKANLQSVIFVFTGMTFFALGVTGILAWTPLSLTRIFSLGAAEVGMVLGAVIAAASVAGVAAGNFILRHLQRRLGYRAAPRVVWVSLTVSLPFICLIPFAAAPWQVYGIVAIQVFASTIAGASSVSLLQELAPAPVRARIMALRAMTNGPAVGMGVAGAAFLGDLINAGPASLFWGGLAISAPAWAICIICLRLAEQPFQATARANSGQMHPLDLVAGKPA
ncbi:MFS transporter [Niveispirillum sp.]|uniref:MFS transporter n=1 Tax=Niveispirillum sp. TaxID=1917217 RepID=UPI001B59D371|nr:MFS transporter [Niveispirillum sp.]MBP7336731.1 MFS transporter [Niveispirillum sp.]